MELNNKLLLQLSPMSLTTLLQGGPPIFSLLIKRFGLSTMKYINIPSQKSLVTTNCGSLPLYKLTFVNQEYLITWILVMKNK